MTLQEEWVDLLAAICSSPEDWELRLVAADWCEEHDPASGGGRAECLRWMVRHKKRAMASHSGSWHWYDESVVGGVLTDHDPGSNLPRPLWSALSRHSDMDGTACKVYDSRAASEDDLLWAWQTVRGDGWAPEE